VTRIAVVNCNTTAAMTQVIAARAQAAVQPGTEILGITPRWGVASAEGWFDSFISATAVLYELERLPDGIDGVVMAGFGEHGREGARELLDVPVVDITEAAAHLAMPLGRRFGIVTPLARSISQIEDSLATAGLLSHCAAIEDIGLGVLDLDSDPGRTRDAFTAAALRAIGRGAEVICLGCAGLAGIEQHLRHQVPVPVVDGVAAAAAMVETLIRSGLTTSKAGSYAQPLSKARTWSPQRDEQPGPAAGAQLTR
jgi:allantoin racemase